MDELNTLFPDNTVTLSDGSTVAVNEFTFGQLPRVLAKSKSIFGIVRQLYEDGEAGMASTLLIEGGEDFIELLMISTGKPRAWFDTLRAEDGLLISTHFLEVNLSFFAQKVVPAFKTGMGRLKTARGLIPS